MPVQNVNPHNLINYGNNFNRNLDFTNSNRANNNQILPINNLLTNQNLNYQSNQFPINYSQGHFT